MPTPETRDAASNICDRCGHDESLHQDVQRFCPFYSTFRPRTPPAGVVVWVARDDLVDLPMLYAEQPTKDHGRRSGSLALIGAIPDPLASALGLVPGECAAFRLVRVAG